MVAALQVVGEGQDAGRLEAQKLAKALNEFHLPNETSQLIGWTQDRFEDGIRGFFLAGLGLIKLHMTTTNTYSVILEQNFPGLNQRVAENYMAVTKAAINHPAFQAFQKERGGYSKMLTALNICSEAELEAADETGELLGYSMDQLAKMSVRTMQKALMRAREHEKLAVRKATERLSDDLGEALARVKELEAQVEAEKTPADAALKLVLSAHDKIFEGIRLLGKVREAGATEKDGVGGILTTDKTVREQMVGVCEHAINILMNLSTDATHAGAVEGADY